MTLRQLLETIIFSSPKDWYYINGSPSYHDQLTLNSDQVLLEIRSHDETAVYKCDVSITMAWGLPKHENFTSEWTKKFPNHSASTAYLDIFYNNAVVFRAFYVEADNGKKYLPLSTNLKVPVGYSKLIRLLIQIPNPQGAVDYDEYFSSAGFEEVDELWPKGL